MKLSSGPRPILAGRNSSSVESHCAPRSIGGSFVLRVSAARRNSGASSVRRSD